MLHLFYLWQINELFIIPNAFSNLVFTIFTRFSFKQNQFQIKLQIMSEESIDEIQFEDPNKQELFEMLISQKKFETKAFSQQDLKVDLVLKMPIPQYSYDLKSREFPFEQVFKNTPDVYQEIYNLVSEYILYLVQRNQEVNGLMNPIVRTMTSLMEMDPHIVKKAPLDLSADHSEEEKAGKFIDIECNFEGSDKIDTFTLKYNMLMIILEKLCGFRVRTFILEDQPSQINGQVTRNLSIYFLLSLSSDNLLKLAEKYRIKKQINMSNLDFLVNDPTDSKGRPVKINSFFKTKQVKAFSQTVKRLGRDLGLSSKLFSNEIIEEAQLSQREIHNFEQYFQELQSEVNKVFPPRQFKDKLVPPSNHKKRGGTSISRFHKKAASASNIKEVYKRQKQFGNIPYLDPENTKILNNQGLKRLSKYQRQYLYQINRHKTNSGCEEILLTIKKKQYIFNKIISLNKKYGYKYFQYKDTFMEFELPSKHKPFFQKLEHILQYEYYNSSPYGELSLFTNMQKIKLAFLNLQRFIKIEGLQKSDIEIFTINNEYERSGDSSCEYNKNYRNNGSEQEEITLHKRSNFLKEAYSWIPFKTDTRVVRDYLGDNFGFELSFKISILVYFLIISPFALAFEVGYQFYFRSYRTKQYLSSFFQLLLLFFSYSVFIQIWKKKEDKYFNNFIEKYESNDVRAEYKGPYIRNIVTDNYSQFEKNTGFLQTLRNIIAYITITSVFIILVFYFGAIRIIIVANYTKFPTFLILSFSHLTFYGFYFLSVGLLYEYIIKRHIFLRLVRVQNYARISEHDDIKRRIEYFFVFSLELIGPLYFFIIQNFNGTTCHAENCVIQFEIYVISRYVLELLYNLIKNIYRGVKIVRNYYTRQKYEKSIETSDKDLKKTYQFKMSKLLLHIQYEYSKEEMKGSVKSDMTVFMFFSIFFIRFALCQIFSLIVLFFDYVIKREVSMSIKRRPIPDSVRIYRYTPVLNKMYYMSLIVNSFSLIFNDSFLEYDLKSFYSVFVPNMTQDNMFTYKLGVTVVLFIFFLIATGIFRKIGKLFGESKKLEKRKNHKFKEFMKKSTGAPTDKRGLSTLIPLKTIFRTFALETIIDYKKNKFNFLKRKLKPIATPRPSEIIQPQKSDIVLSKNKSIRGTSATPGNLRRPSTIQDSLRRNISPALVGQQSKQTAFNQTNHHILDDNMRSMESLQRRDF